MIYSVRGPLVHTEPGMAVVECAGVGYRCLTSNHTLSKLGPKGGEVRLFTQLVLRDDSADLFGFYDAEELACFKMLTAVTGVGPKAGLAILSILPPDRVALAVLGGDAKAFTQVAGVGPKLASRIILELKDKLGSAGFVPADSGVGAAVLPGMQDSRAEALAALVVLGYNQTEAASAIAKCGEDMPVQDMIKTALKALSGRQR